MRPRRSRDPAWHHPLERVWCISIRSWLLLCSSQLRIRRLRYANAGHNLPCRRHNGQADELRARGMPLGLMPGMAYEEKEAALEVGDSTLFYSDGLVEAHNPQREMFGFPRLRRLVAEHDAEEGSLVDFLMD